MALAIDASTPAVATQATGTTTTVTTASFTPPAGSLLAIRWDANSVNGANPTTPSITDSLGVHLTYTLLDWRSRVDASPANLNGQVATWWAVVGASAPMTVTVTNGAASGSRHAALHVTVFTGQDPVTPIGAHGKAGSASASSIAQGYTATLTGGIGLIAVCDWDATGDMVAGSGCTLTDGGTGTIPTTQISYGFLRRTLFDDVTGVTNNLNVTIGGTSTNLTWAWFEVLPSTAVAQGRVSTNRHPGAGPGTARFYKTPQDTKVQTGNVVNIDGSLTVTANRTATVAVTHTVGGSLTVTATRTATIAITHTVGGSLTVTANRTATVAVTHTVGGSLTVTVNRTATVAVTHTIGGTRPITVGLAATVAVTHTIGGTRVTTVNRVATVAVTHVVAGTRPITVGLTASIITGKDISGSRPTTVNRTASIAITHTVGGSLSVVCVRSADAATGGGFAQFLPFF